MSKSPQLRLPESHAHLMTDSDYEVHDRWAARSLDDVISDMGVSTTKELSNSLPVSYIDTIPKEADPTEAVAWLYPFGNGYSPAMDMRTKFAMDLLKKPMRSLQFPNGESFFDTEGIKSPGIVMAASVLEVAASAGVEKLHIVGASQGAMVGGHILSQLGFYFDINEAGAFLAEPPNITVRTPSELSTAFRKGGLRALNRAINNSGVPALSQAQASRGLYDLPRQMIGMTAFGFKSGTEMNRHLKADMAKNSFVQDMYRFNGRPERTVVARMADSLICLASLDDQLAMKGQTVEVVDGYGHEGPDNIVLNGLLARKAILG